ncbi:MAG: hypothetical protein ACMXX7_01255 [Candidatus Woesearchaeota archaeon]
MGRIKKQKQGFSITSQLILMLGTFAMAAMIILIPFNAASSVMNNSDEQILAKDIALTLQVIQSSPGPLEVIYLPSIEDKSIDISQDTVTVRSLGRSGSETFNKIDQVEIQEIQRQTFLSFPIRFEQNTINFTIREEESCDNITIDSLQTLRIQLSRINNEDKTRTLENNLRTLIENDQRIQIVSQNPHIHLYLEVIDQNQYEIKYFSQDETSLYRRLSCEIQKELEETRGVINLINEPRLELTVNFTDATKILNALRRITR